MAHSLPITLGLMLLFSCGDAEEDGVGSLSLRISGEEAALVGFPVPEEPALAFADGWSLKFERYLVSVGNVRLEDEAGSVGLAGSDTVIVDLTRSASQLVFEFDDLGAKRWERFSYDILPARTDARTVGEIPEKLVQRMIDEKLNYLIEGMAKKEDRELRFSWGLRNPTRNSECINSVDDTPGIVIRKNTVAEYEITLHLDHLFYDTLGDHDGVDMRFEAIAAVAEEGAEGWVIPFEKLKSQRLADLKDVEGNPLLDEEGAPLVYEPGSVPLEEPTLFHYLLAAAKSQGRFNGEGYCKNTDL